MSEALLVEVLTEELPPSSLVRLGDAFRNGIQDWLIRAQLKTRVPDGISFATPRRLAALIPDVRARAEDRTEPKRLMPTKIAFQTDGRPSVALLKRLEKEGVSSITDANLERRVEGQTEYAFLNVTIPGITVEQGLQIALMETIGKLPIRRLMSYQLADGKSTEHFVRPAHGVVALHGNVVLNVSVLGLKSTNVTRGHRFLTDKPITIKNANDYVRALREEGKVEVSFNDRRAKIKAELTRIEEELAREIARTPDGRIPIDVQPLVADTERPEHPGHIFPGAIDLDAVERALVCSGGSSLLDEVTALVEWPRAYWGRFDREFLEIPIECLALTMKQHQRYFPVFDKSARLLPYFVLIGNNDETLKGDQAKQVINNIVSGNERVLRPRLADARFFYDHDRKDRLESRVPRLAQVVFHSRLGSQRDRIDRIKLLAGKIARDLGSDSALAERAAELCKADLLTGMVGEFPELQGVMGRYYASHDGESQIVSDAIAAHYRPRFAGDRLPDGFTACSVALADKLDTLAGLFGIGEQPSGEKDPFALRRAALGVIRILIENKYALPLNDLVNGAFKGYPTNLKIGDAHTDLETFIFERLRGYLREAGYTANEIESVLCMRPMRMDQVLLQLAAIREFARLPEAQSLVAANKRVANILKQAESKGEFYKQPQANWLREPAEIDLFDVLKKVSKEATTLFQKGDYTGYLKAFAVLKSPIDVFFDSVMVMTDELPVRRNRLALLADLRQEMNRVADLSRLAA